MKEKKKIKRIKKKKKRWWFSINRRRNQRFLSSKKIKTKKKYENKPNNEYLDLLLNFVMNNKPEFNSGLSGYFANIILH